MTENNEQIEFWNGPRAEQWVAGQEVLDQQLAPFGAAAIEAAGFATGERVIDIGCGCGATTLEIATAVGPTGSVLGVDVSQPMLARARARAAAISQLHFECGDAATFGFDGRADAVFSRFGVMFFANPQAAFANLKRALCAKGRLAFVCWRPLSENPWMNVPLAAAGTVIPARPPPADAPGPYSLSDPDRVRELLEGSGFRHVSIVPFDHRVAVGAGGGLDAATTEAVTIGPAARLFVDASPEAQERGRTAVREALAPFLDGGDVRLAAAAWIMTAGA